MASELITPKRATECATNFYRETTGNFPSMTLEEIELKGDYWYVTIGFPKTAMLYDQKEYKLFKVNANTGAVESMTIRK